jgi:hypothetical protein
MTTNERDALLNLFMNFAYREKKLDLSVIIADFKNSPEGCTHELHTIAKEGYLTCRCGKVIRWPDNDR